MAERTISVKPLPNIITIDQLQAEFAGLGVERVALIADEATAYLQFRKPAEVQALTLRYPDCHVPALGNAQIGLVEAGFRWPLPKVTGRAECLVVVRGCAGLVGITQTRIRQIFKQYAIEKVAKFEESGEVVLQFHSQDDLELIEMNFDNYAVPELGSQARIDVDNAFPIEKFLQRYLERNQVREVSLDKEKQEQISHSSQKVEEQSLSRKKLEEMQRQIAQKERLRKNEVEVFQRARREKEERQRIQRYAREKKERDERERREQIELEERKRQQQRKKEQEQRKQQEQARFQEIRKQQELREAELKRRQQEEEQRMLAERIASIKQEVEEVERKMKKETGVQDEPQLQRILSQQKQFKKKQIKLPEINKLQVKEVTSSPSKTEKVEVSPAEEVFRPTVSKDYSGISLQFITIVAVAWLYYVLVR